MKNNILRLRKKKKLSLKDLSDKSGVSGGYIWLLEKGHRKNPSADMMIRIADALDENFKNVWRM
jgi:transcriptional regulator with XRE-family HTH domain